MVPGTYLVSKFTVALGIGFAPPLNWGPKPMISRVSTPWAWAWPAASSAAAANREAMARVIILPREKSGFSVRASHNNCEFASRGDTEAPIFMDGVKKAWRCEYTKLDADAAAPLPLLSEEARLRAKADAGR